MKRVPRCPLILDTLLSPLELTSCLSTLVTTDEPVLMLYDELNPIVYIRARSCVMYFYGICNSAMPYPLLQRHTELLHRYEIPCTAAVCPSVSRQSPGNHSVHILAFSDWLLSLNNMHLSFLHVFSWLDSSFPFFFFHLDSFS